VSRNATESRASRAYRRLLASIALSAVVLLAVSTESLAEQIITQAIRTFGLGTLEAVAYSPDGRYIATCGGGGAFIWDVQTGSVIRTFTGHTYAVTSVAFSPDGTKVLTGSGDCTAKLWDAATGACIRTFTGHTDSVYSVAFSPDGSKVLTGSVDNTAKLWDAATGSLIRTFTGHSSYVLSVAFSPDGTKVLTGSWDNTAKLWDAATGACIRTFTGHSSIVMSVAFSPDGTKVLTGSWDGTAKLWDAATGSLIRTFTGHTEMVWSVAFSPDGTKVLTGSYDGTAKLWWSGLAAITVTITPSQSWNAGTNTLSLSASVYDTAAGRVTGGIFTWSLRDSSGTERASGSMAWNASAGQWRASRTIAGGLPAGSYTVHYGMTTDRGRLGTAAGNLSVAGSTVTVAGTVSDAAGGSPLSGAQVAMFQANVLWWLVNALHEGNVPDLATLLSKLAPARGPVETGADGRYQWTGIASGGSYVIVAKRTGYSSASTPSFSISAGSTSITKDLRLTVDTVNTLAALGPAVQDVRSASERIINRNARLAGDATQQWYKDNLYSITTDWFNRAGDLIGLGTGIAGIVNGAVEVTREVMLEITARVLAELVKELAFLAADDIRIMVTQNQFPRDELAYKASVLHVTYADRLEQTAGNFTSTAGSYPLAAGFSQSEANRLARQTIEQVNTVVDGTNRYVVPSTVGGDIYGFTLPDMLNNYMSLSQTNAGYWLTEMVLSGVQIAGGAITIAGAASVVGAPLAGVAATAREAAGFGKSAVKVAKLENSYRMASTFATAIAGTYPRDNEQAVRVLDHYVGFLHEESQTPFYLHSSNRFSASTEVDMNFLLGIRCIYALGLVPGFDTARGVATVTVTDKSTISSGPQSASVRCVGVSIWNPITMGSILGFWKETLMTSSEIAGPYNVGAGGSARFPLAYRGFTKNFVSMFIPHYLQVDTYAGPWRVDSTYKAFYVLAPLEIFRPLSAQEGEEPACDVKLPAATAHGLLSLSELRGLLPAQIEPAKQLLSAAAPTLTAHYTAEAELFAVDFLLFAPHDQSVSILVTDGDGRRLGYSSQDGITYTEMVGSVTNMDQRPICLRLLDPPEGQNYTITVALLSPGPQDVPVTLFIEPVPRSGAVMTAYPSMVLLDGPPETTQTCAVQAGEITGQQALTGVTAGIGTVAKWQGTSTLTVEGKPEQPLGTISAGGAGAASWDVQYSAQTERGKYTGSMSLDSDQTVVLPVPVIALVRKSTEIVTVFKVAGQTDDPPETSVMLAPDGKGWAYVRVPAGLRVVHAVISIAAGSADLLNPAIDIAGDGSVEWAFSGRFDAAALVNHVEDGFGRYLKTKVHSPGASFDVPILLSGKPGETVDLNGIQLYLDTLAGDVNSDCRVNILDLIFIRNRLGQDVSVGDNWMADANEDGKINILDLIKVRGRLNTTCF